jgi:hypothetical protein
VNVGRVGIAVCCDRSGERETAKGHANEEQKCADTPDYPVTR